MRSDKVLGGLNRVLALIALLSSGALAAGDVARLQEMADGRQFFLLRETLQQPGWNKADTLFYRGMVESRFGREPKGIGDLTRFLARRPSSPDRRREAHEELADALVREGRYGEAARNLAEVVRLSAVGERTDSANSQRLYAALDDVPPQSVVFETDASVRATFNVLGSWEVPVEVNGGRGQWIFDTGANWSTLSAGEAERLRLQTRDSDTYVKGSTGKRNPLRLAIADDLRLGRAHLKHVVFLVLSDDSLFVGPLKYQIRGILGLPVLRALRRVGIAANGDVRIEPGGTAKGAPNMFFDGLTPIVEVRHDERRMRMSLDTGSNTSFLYGSFRSALTQEEADALTTRDEQTGGAGEIVVRKTDVVRSLRLLVSGRPVDLSNVSLLTTAPDADARTRDGVLGADALRPGFMLDFRAMQLRLD